MLKKTLTITIIITVLNIILIALLILGVYLFFDRIFGNSPTDFQLILWLAGFFGMALVKGATLMYDLNGEIGETKIKSFHAFAKIKTDTKDIKREINNIKELVAKRKTK